MKINPILLENFQVLTGPFCKKLTSIVIADNLESV